MQLASLPALLGLPKNKTTKQKTRLKLAGCTGIQTKGKRKIGWLHPAQGEKKNGLDASSPRRREKWAGCIQPMGKRNMG
jgi:hypothetical protein